MPPSMPPCRSASGRQLAISAALLAGLFLASGCGHTGQYKKVAKEWALSMRAQQMIPVYPLSEDLRPGDVFLVSTSAAAEADRYEEGGFLSLDDHRARLTGLNYSSLYADGFFKNTYTPPIVTPALDSTAPTPAPRVVFPSYTFTVKKGVAGGLGLPVSGIPLALNYSGARTATGSVTITDASTYAVDQDQLGSALSTWLARTPERAYTLGRSVAEHGHRAKDGEPYLILRVIQRVYLARAVDVSLSYETQSAGGAKAGLPGSTDAPAPDTETFADSVAKQKTLLDTLNTLAADAKIGGQVNFKSFTSRGVSLTQRFDRPLVIGYLGLDIPVFQDGSLGAPVPTYQRLREPRLQSPSRIAFENLALRLDHLEALSAAADHDRALRIVREVLAAVPADTFRPEERKSLAALLAEADAAAAKPDPALHAAKTADIVTDFSSYVTVRAKSPDTRSAIRLDAALTAALARE